uniref:Uncharacterized protein n=1 Tax=Picea sitchensis TaxID=3332 RepID=D5ACQ0_PICSI|nr:unknown [Picea sitchensis]
MKPSNWTQLSCLQRSFCCVLIMFFWVKETSLGSRSVYWYCSLETGNLQWKI